MHIQEFVDLLDSLPAEYLVVQPPHSNTNSDQTTSDKTEVPLSPAATTANPDTTSVHSVNSSVTAQDSTSLTDHAPSPLPSQPSSAPPRPAPGPSRRPVTQNRILRAAHTNKVCRVRMEYKRRMLLCCDHCHAKGTDLVCPDTIKWHRSPLAPQGVYLLARHAHRLHVQSHINA